MAPMGAVGKSAGLVGVGGVAGDDGERLEAAAIGFRPAHEDERGGAVGDGAGVGGGDRAAFAKCGLEMRDFVGRGFERELVVSNDSRSVLPAFTVSGNDFSGEAAVGGGLLRAGERGEREFVLRFAREGDSFARNLQRRCP